MCKRTAKSSDMYNIGSVTDEFLSRLNSIENNAAVIQYVVFLFYASTAF